MTARALLNVVEAHILGSLEGEARASMRRTIADPVGTATEIARQAADETKNALLEAGGEIG